MFAINRGGGLISSAEQTPSNAQAASPPRRTPVLPVGTSGPRQTSSKSLNPCLSRSQLHACTIRPDGLSKGAPLGRDIDRHGSPLHWRNPWGWLGRLGWLVLLRTPLLPKPRTMQSHSERALPYRHIRLCLGDGRLANSPLLSLISFPARTSTAEWRDLGLSSSTVAALASRSVLEGGVCWEGTVREGDHLQTRVAQRRRRRVCGISSHAYI